MYLHNSTQNAQGLSGRTKKDKSSTPSPPRFKRQDHFYVLGCSTKKFASLKADGKLLRPDQRGNVIAKLAVESARELIGKFLKYVVSQALWWTVLMRLKLEWEGFSCIPGILMSCPAFLLRSQRECDGRSIYRIHPVSWSSSIVGQGGYRGDKICSQSKDEKLEHFEQQQAIAFSFSMECFVSSGK